jgi:hypothetical protein
MPFPFAFAWLNALQAVRHSHRNSLGKAGRLLFSVVKTQIFFVGWGWGGWGKKEVAIFGQAIKFDCSFRSPTSLTPHSNGNDVGNGNGNKVAGDKEDNGEGGKSDGDGVCWGL